MEAAIGGTEQVVETLRRIAVSMVAEDPTSSSYDLPAQLEDLVQQYIELTQAGEQAPEMNIPMQLIRLVDEGKEPAAFVDQQLKAAYTQSLGTAMSVDALQDLRQDLAKVLDEDSSAPAGEQQQQSEQQAQQGQE